MHADHQLVFKNKLFLWSFTDIQKQTLVTNLLRRMCTSKLVMWQIQNVKYKWYKC